MEKRRRSVALSQDICGRIGQRGQQRLSESPGVSSVRFLRRGAGSISPVNLGAFHREAQEGQNADLKKAPQTALLTIQQHLKMAQYLAAKKGGQ
ncbi:hypothetical protein [Caballeronia arvi]|uniref:hypothetical protein n=1 Tax=Caballeronia arvi TaxID=1777135 RepID=UPI000772CA20|nr:hypothetical protein [Caballeronia arvi]